MRLVPDARARAMMRAIARINFYSTAELFLLAVLAVQAARLFWAILTPVTPLGDWRPAEPGYAGSPAAILTGFDPFFRLSGGDAKPAIVTSLKLTLYGTRIDGAMGGGSAIIAGPDGVQQSIAVGQEISPGVKLKSVAFDHVTIDRGGASEDLYLAQDGSPAPPLPTAGPALLPVPQSATPTPTPAGASSAGVTIAQLQSDIGFIPRIDGGRISGLVLRAQGSGAAFRQAGLRDGDVLTAIAGRPVTGPGDIERLGAQYPHGGTLPITIERGNDTRPIVITIAQP